MTANETEQIDQEELPEIVDHFPLQGKPRQGQLDAFTFIRKAIERGYRDIVIEAPTGAGKSAIGAAAAYWAAQLGLQTEDYKETQAGAVYLVTQKLLQDQLERDVKENPDFVGDSIKTSAEYNCPTFGNCGIGLKAGQGEKSKGKKCPLIGGGDVPTSCTYKRAKARYDMSIMGITNYAFFLTERLFGKPKPPRDVLIVDECHTLERQLTLFSEMTIDDKLLAKHELPRMDKVPVLKTLKDYGEWIRADLLPIAEDRAEIKRGQAESTGEVDGKLAKEALSLEKFVDKLKYFLSELLDDKKRENWVYWQEEEKKGNSVVNRSSIARPLDAAPYMPLITKAAAVRIYMSAYPGSKEVFCRSLGLDPEEVAWKRLPSTFPVENRPINMTFAGSMSRRNFDNTWPSFIGLVDKILTKFDDTKGIIHCNSYKLGNAIYEHFQQSEHEHRLLFPRNADERVRYFQRHQQSPDATVMLSPSITEGFDFKGELANWQIIAKVPYPYLGDKQVAAKKDKDPEWYAMQTVMTIIQASGRICRNESDTGITFITDDDFMMLWDRNRKMFPGWWKDAVRWGKSRR